MISFLISVISCQKWFIRIFMYVQKDQTDGIQIAESKSSPLLIYVKTLLFLVPCHKCLPDERRHSAMQMVESRLMENIGKWNQGVKLILTFIQTTMMFKIKLNSKVRFHFQKNNFVRWSWCCQKHCWCWLIQRMNWF